MRLLEPLQRGLAIGPPHAVDLAGIGALLAQALLERGAPLHVAGNLRAEEWQGNVSAGFFIADAAAA